MCFICKVNYLASYFLLLSQHSNIGYAVMCTLSHTNKLISLVPLKRNTESNHKIIPLEILFLPSQMLRNFLYFWWLSLLNFP